MIEGKTFVSEWIVLRDGDHYNRCTFIDCVMTRPRLMRGSATISNSTLSDCTFVQISLGKEWPYETLRQATKAHEPEVISAMTKPDPLIGLKSIERQAQVLMNRALYGDPIRPAPRQRRSIFNWRKRD